MKFLVSYNHVIFNDQLKIVKKEKCKTVFEGKNEVEVIKNWYRDGGEKIIKVESIL